jgi:hypothetical protein
MFRNILVRIDVSEQVAEAAARWRLICSADCRRALAPRQVHGDDRSQPNQDEADVTPPPRD